MILKLTRGFKRYFGNAAWLLSEKVLRMTSGVFVGILVAKYLGPELFGRFSYVMALLALISVVTRMGLDPVVVRNVVNDKLHGERYITAALSIRLIASAIILIPIFFISIVYDSTETFLFLSIVMSGLVFQSYDVVAFYYEAHVQSKLISICKIIQLILSTALKLYLVIEEFDLLYFFMSVLIDAFVLCLLYMYLYFKYSNYSLCWSDLESNVKSMLLDSWPLMVTGLSLILFSQTDKIMINHLIGEYEVGIYSAGARFSEAMSFIPAVLAAALFPAILNARSSDLDLYNSRLKKFYFLMTWLGIMLMFVLITMSGFLMNLYGDKFHEGQIVLIIHSISLIFVFQWTARGRWIIAENLQKLTFYYIAFGAVFNIFLNYYLIGVFGIVGAAVSTVVSQFLIALIFPLFFKPMRESTKVLLRSFFTWR